MRGIIYCVGCSLISSLPAGSHISAPSRLDPSCCTRFLLANGAPKMFRSANRVNVEAHPLLRHRASTVPNDLLHHWPRARRARGPAPLRAPGLPPSVRPPRPGRRRSPRTCLATRLPPPRQAPRGALSPGPVVQPPRRTAPSPPLRRTLGRFSCS